MALTQGGPVVHATTNPTKKLALNTGILEDAHRRTCLSSKDHVPLVPAF